MEAPVLREAPGHALHLPDLGLPTSFVQAWCSCGWRSDPGLAHHWAAKQAYAHFDEVRGFSWPPSGGHARSRPWSHDPA